MATWNSKKVKTKLDYEIEFVDTEVRWEFNTTCDRFRFIKKGKFNNSYDSNEFEETHSMGEDEALVMFQALGNWIELYHNESVVKKMLENNIFEYEDDE